MEDIYSCFYCCKICQSHLNLFVVSRETPILVKPALPTPHHVLPLPNRDIFSAQKRFSTYSHLMFFQTDLEINGTNFVEKMREALAYLLVLYYPLAGRLRATEHGELEAVCYGDGAIFIEAHADARLADLKRLEKPYLSELQYDATHAENSGGVPALIAQVTKLTCGGFALGIQVSETLCDATGIMHFLYGWAEIGQGKQEVSVSPVWERKAFSAGFQRLRFHFPTLSLFHDHQKFSCQHERLKADAFVPLTHIELSSEAGISLVKYLSKEGIFKCNAFEALAAHVWRERTRALDTPHSKEVRLFFFADISSGTPCTSPTAFYGHYAFNCQAKTTVGELVQRPLSYAVRLIQASKASLRENLVRCATDFAELHCPGGWIASEVLLFTHEPSKHDGYIEFSGRRAAYLDGTSPPPHLNVASIGHGSRVGSGVLHITVNNVPEGCVEKLTAYISDVFSQSKMENSKL